MRARVLCERDNNTKSNIFEPRSASGNCPNDAIPRLVTLTVCAKLIHSTEAQRVGVDHHAFASGSSHRAVVALLCTYFFACFGLSSWSPKPYQRPSTALHAILRRITRRHFAKARTHPPRDERRRRCLLNAMPVSARPSGAHWEDEATYVSRRVSSSARTMCARTRFELAARASTMVEDMITIGAMVNRKNDLRDMRAVRRDRSRTGVLTGARWRDIARASGDGNTEHFTHS